MGGRGARKQGKFQFMYPHHFRKRNKGSLICDILVGFDKKLGLSGPREERSKFLSFSLHCTVHHGAAEIF